MSRGDELRQLAAQLSVLAALEDSIAQGQGYGPRWSWSRRCTSRCWFTLSSRCSRRARSASGGAFAQS